MEEEYIKEYAAAAGKKSRAYSMPNLGLDDLQAAHFADFRLPRFELDMVTDRCGSTFVVRKGNRFRKVWTVLVVIMLVYTGTIFMYRMSFVEFRIQMDSASDDAAWNGIVVTSNDGWITFDALVTCFFWVDLVLNFFFTYENSSGTEVESLRLIATHYLQFYFWVNLIGCLPEEFVSTVVHAFYSDDAPTALSQGLRVVRLQRVYRLARLLRLARLGRLLKVRKMAWVRAMDRRRNFRLLNLSCGLLLVVHLLACGWYICAAMHNDPGLTWVARRSVDASGEVPLIMAPPFDQWAHSMYFILTVFTTVGFGDMSAGTVGEIFYVCFVMAIGAVVHSIIVGEVIGLVTNIDKTNQYVENQVDLIDAFSEHTELDKNARSSIRSWIRSSARFWVSHRFDKQEMKEILTSKCMPRALMGRLPPALFEGKLLVNSFINVHRCVCDVPPRLPILIALLATKTNFKAGDLIYQTQDFPFNLFLVMSGTFSYVACPSEMGGLPYSEAIMEFEMKFRKSTKLAAAARLGAVPSGAAVGATTNKEGDDSPDVEETPLSPYQTFSCGSYFGDIELLKDVQRKTTARCEVEGDLLVLRKDDVRQLAAEFPQFHTKWASAASHRETVRTEKQALLVEPQDFREYAVRVIVRELRRLRDRQVQRNGFGLFRYKSRHYGSIYGHTVGTASDDSTRQEMSELRREVQGINKRLDTVVAALASLAESKTIIRAV